MRIVSLEPYLSELTCYLGFHEALVGVSHRCDYPEDLIKVPKVTVARELSHTLPPSPLAAELGPDAVNFEALKAAAPDIILTSVEDSDDGKHVRELRGKIKALFGDHVELFAFHPHTLTRVFEMFEGLGKALGNPTKGHDLSQRVKAQVMDWGENFYERMHNKRVSFIGGVKPYRLGGYWIPDMIHMASAVSHMPAIGKEGTTIDFSEIVLFKPDVIIVAPEGFTLKESMAVFKEMEKLPDWEKIPAVKRGEVAFTDGIGHFHRPTARLIESMGILVSAIAGFDSGYITARDSFYRLRWLEMQRHRF